MFYVENLEDPVLIAPAFGSENNNKLLIITGYISVDRIKTHILRLKDEIDNSGKHVQISIDVIIGMRSGLSVKKRDQIVKCIHDLNDQRSMPKINCFVVETGKEVHSKIYIWCNKTTPSLAFCGSVNYTIEAFEKRRESISSCDAELAYQYYKRLRKDCTEISKISLSNLPEESTPNNGDSENDSIDKWEDYDIALPVAILDLSLLKSDGTDVGHGSGINWGHRKNGTKRDLNQAYIAYPAKKRKISKGFFPDELGEGKKNYPLFKVLLEHGDSCYMRLCQANIKGIQSADSNAILGLWIRKEIGVESGVFVTREMLIASNKMIARFEKYVKGESFIYRLKLIPDTQ